jgi:amino acid adenylation domain-containing protein
VVSDRQEWDSMKTDSGLLRSRSGSGDSRAPAGAACSTVPECFLHTVRNHTARTAISSVEGDLSYGALAERAGAIAGALSARGIGKGAIVGLVLRRGADAVAAMLGVLQVGAAYLPLDPSYPPKLLRFIYEDSAPSVVLVDPAVMREGALEPFWDGEALAIGELSNATDPGPVPATILADDPAYVMYTSGSTGRPKGVLIPHRGIVRLVHDNPFAQLDAGQVMLQLAPLSFDASTFEIWGALLNGGRLAVLAETHPSLDAIAAAIQRHGVTTLWLTAGLFHLMVDHRLDGLRPLRQLLAGGDVLSVPHVERALRALPDCRLINGYGPTENTTFTCCYTIPHQLPLDGPIPIGTPIANTEVHILDEALQPVAEGEEGELYAGGAGVALGYLNRPELTAERFIVNPFDASGRTRLYRTGDRVRRRADGNIEFCGRIDRQVKISGKRVELDEVENSLRRLRDVADAAVVSVDGADGQRRIAAFVTPQTGRALSADALRQVLREEMPDYMLPSSITVLDALPLTPTGKVDRARLPVATDTKEAPARAGEALPADRVEVELLRIWREVLGTQRVGVDDNFFDLGGTSLQLTKAHALIQASLGTPLALVDLFQYPRIRALAEHIARRGATAPAGPAISVQDRARRQNEALERARRLRERSGR